jgi:hypothetical protein
MEIFTEAIGWIGMSMITFAYVLISLKKVDGANNIYQLLNFVGAIGLAVNVSYQKAWPALAQEVVWGAVALFALTRNLKNMLKKTEL